MEEGGTAKMTLLIFVLAHPARFAANALFQVSAVVIMKRNKKGNVLLVHNCASALSPALSPSRPGNQILRCFKRSRMRPELLPNWTT